MSENFGMIHGVSWIFWLSFIVLILWLYTVLTNRNVKSKHSKKIRINNKTALEILEKRYVEGEINDNEYKERKENLLKDVMP
ncbi:MAG: SHOCT domain-containing protein [Gammaproteobacteria bacterium]|nr:SHOCT domain-containing protein [Gammaproteobacteria bacterium]